MTKEVMIGAIIDKKTGETKTPHRIGRVCSVDFEIGSVAIIEYPNGGWWRTSTVLSFQECEYGYWIETLNTNYRFDYIEML